MLYQRHIFFRTAANALGCVALFVAVLLAGNAIKDVLHLLSAGRLGFALFAHAIAILVPSALSYALPMGMLNAVLLTVGRMAANGELLAMRAAGMSPRRITLPILLLAAIGTAASAGINLFYAPRALCAYRQNLRAGVRNNPLPFLIPGRFILDFPGHIFRIGGREGDVLIQPQLWQCGENGTITGYLRAERGRLAHSPDDGQLLLALESGTVERLAGGGGPIYFHTFTVTFPTGGRHPVAAEKRLKHCDLFELLAARRLTATGATAAQIRSHRIAVNLTIQRHLAMAAAVFTLTLLAIPLAVRSHRGESSFHTAAALLIALGYYFATAAISWLADHPFLRADWLIWLPNGAVLAAALALLRPTRHFPGVL
jgi:lipopolysaccharide export system permease protein